MAATTLSLSSPSATHWWFLLVNYIIGGFVTLVCIFILLWWWFYLRARKPALDLSISRHADTPSEFRELTGHQSSGIEGAPNPGTGTTPNPDTGTMDNRVALSQPRKYDERWIKMLENRLARFKQELNLRISVGLTKQLSATQLE
ncbi:hypothetical protein FE257_004718 [Aspergillus nanangensis]|uniref:Uncharacterized protein n=1 Tax=Aspergillus nanangensis TaxID=2582783 RepID=A0AAD4CYN3_ASPNN|nr:hypothetical protein FE257_004718 [Aspergillus nanangensis]